MLRVLREQLTPRRLAPSKLAAHVRFLRVVAAEVFEDPGNRQRLHRCVNRVFFPDDPGLAT